MALPSWLMERAIPNWSNCFAFDALMYACCDQTPGLLFAKTYTAPDWGAELFAWLPPIPVALLASPYAPTAIVAPSPLMASPKPKLSNGSVFDAFTYPIAAIMPLVTIA